MGLVLYTPGLKPLLAVQAYTSGGALPLLDGALAVLPVAGGQPTSLVGAALADTAYPPVTDSLSLLADADRFTVGASAFTIPRSSVQR
ncbi:hypothetical protein ACSDBR_07190 [Acidithiobacillus ferriphilus]|uniref:hypothetical protein n=1 Tax=Acidithiobacillus ferriphilus TaxID=1689834 RepID=UPI003F519FB8